MIKILIGGSPCTHWSVAQKNNRETEPNGIGWELFKNYLVAKERFKPDYFLYENNKSAAQPIKDQISRELGTPLQYINSALVSAQNRQRFYAHNIPGVAQPEDRHILLKDILESGADLSQNEKAYCLIASYNGAVAWNTLERNQRSTVAEPVIFNVPHGFNKGGFKYGKSPTLTANGDWQHNNFVTEPIRIGSIGSNSQAHRVYSCYGKSINLVANGGGQRAKTGLYAIEIKPNSYNERKIKELCDKFGYIPEMFNMYNARELSHKSPTQTAQAGTTKSGSVLLFDFPFDGAKPVYKVENGLITINDKQYPIKLPDGYYIIRKLTVTECKRLQTVPDNYIMPCSATQNYKMLGNGWTVDVISHILSHIPNIKNEPVLVLSMYDGMSCGQIAFDKIGANVVDYYSTEIDKYAIQTTQANYPDTIQLGDAFQMLNAEFNPNGIWDM